MAADPPGPPGDLDRPAGTPVPVLDTVGAVPSLTVGIGRRVVVLANLLLGPEATAASTAATAGVAAALEGWEGPGTVVVAGNLFSLPAEGADQAAAASAALAAHPRLAGAFAAYTAEGGERHLLVVPGEADAALAGGGARGVVEELGASVVPRVDLELDLPTARRRVRVEAGLPPEAAAAAIGTQGGPGQGGGVAPAGPGEPRPPWQAGAERLAEPGALPRFVTSRLLYRRFARLAWYLLIPFAVVILLRLPFATGWLSHLFASHPLPDRALNRARDAGWAARLLVALGVAAVGVAALAIVLGVLSRKAWSALGGGVLETAPGAAGATANDDARTAAAQLVDAGYAGLVTGATLQAELTHLGPAFFACVGTSGEVVEEHPGRLGLPPVFLHHHQVAWIELETGADLHARLLLGRADVAPATVLERLVASHRPVHDPHPLMVAAHPSGASWPPAPDLGSVPLGMRRARRWGSAAIAVAGALDLLAAVTPPLREELRLVLQVLPLVVSQAAGALVALSGIGLLALARGVRRGQRRAWAVACVVLAASLAFHLARGGDVALVVISAVVLAYLLVRRADFGAPTDRRSLRSGVVALGAGVVGVGVFTTALVEVVGRIDQDSGRPLGVGRAVVAVLERMVGLRSVALPARLDRFLSPSLATVGMVLAAVVVLLATRPVVDRTRVVHRQAEGRARDVVRRHGSGTLDYFALRSDKSWFFHRDSVVAYGIIGGICLVSPDPIGPTVEREAVWAAFRRFADTQGWVVAVMGAAEEWLPVYRATGMHDVYIGDEAVVDIQEFSLAGGQMKGLRQAFNRIAKYGYTAEFHDPARLPRPVADELAGLMDQSRRGEFERGFSMMLGRIFDPTDEGLLLCVVKGPDGHPAAMCQFVPSPAIGGYSLDLMRRDRGEHPNGLIDFALVSTIEHLRSEGGRGLSLNFAALRSVLDGERGDTVALRVERWALKKMSSFLQIETLWRFNAKYQPDWLPRYVVYDTAEHIVPVLLAILRAESLWEVPVVGRVIAATDRRAHEAAAGRSDSGASLLPVGAPEAEDPTPPRD